MPEPERRSGLSITLDVLREPMLILLMISGAIYLILGELSDALILVFFALFSVVITVVQEVRTEHVLQSLRDLTSPRALVVRDGTTISLPASEVVRGDLIVLREGDRVPADGIIRQGTELQADESLLTGESVPVRKRLALSSDQTEAVPGGDDTPYVFSGTMVVRGTGLAEVVATGARSQIGRIGQTLGQLRSGVPKLQAETRRLTLVFGVLGTLVTIFAMILYGLLRDNWLNAILAGIALGMSMLPEEFPVVLTVFMAMGAWRIARTRVLTRRAAAIEALGSATVLCTDKTGTLTENRMVVAELRLPDGGTWTLADGNDLPEPHRNLLRTGVMASAKDPFDPMERAFYALATASAESIADEWTMIRSYGLTAELLAVAQVWEIGGRGTVVAAKGAPEAIAALCGLTGETLAKLHASVDAMAARGLRVLGLATAQHEGAQCPASPRGFKFTYQGLVGLLDPVRASVPGAIAQCRSAGIRVVMITGDHPQTARAIAEAAGLDASKVRTGAELMAMDDAQLAAAVLSASVFARILPEQKLRIVEALQRHGEVVAMTGDGVNDAPSLKAADIGIAMGQRGTDVAREASAIVLLDDDFDSIVNAVRIGRRIYDNLRKSIEFILAVHVPIAGLGLLPLITGLPILFWPVHIAFLEMIVDPVCSLVFEAEPEEPGIMRRPPRRPDEHLFPVRVIVASAAQGLVALLVAASVYVLILAGGASDDVARAMTMVALVGSILGLIVTNRTFGASLIAALARPTRVLAVVTALVGAVLLSALALPPVRDLFGFAPLNWTQVAIALGASLLALVLLELAKLASLHLAASRTATADPLRKGGS